jgi:peptidoglycan-associated lipoprotein
MNMRTTSLISIVALVALALGACASKPPLNSAAGQGAGAGTAAQGSGADSGNASGTAGAGGTGAYGGTGSTAGAGAPQTKIIYFDFDSSDIKPEFVDVISAHARVISGNATIKVRLEGHTDERGSREYNIGLGERRAQAVRRALLLQGVAEAQVTTVSYGEERPAVTGHEEDAWAKNRRVEIIYVN